MKLSELTSEQKKAFEFHRADAKERIASGCVPTFCSCWDDIPCEDALKGKMHMTVAPDFSDDDYGPEAQGQTGGPC
jgi:hypothetical protein